MKSFFLRFSTKPDISTSFDTPLRTNAFEMDDDIKTDEEQLDLAINHIVQDINTGLQRFQEENNYK